MDSLLDFLAFRTLISRQVLIVFYYLGALGMPLAAWTLALYLLRRFSAAREAMHNGRRLWSAALPRRYRLGAAGLFLLGFVCMELMWRVMFEYLIAFMQMRDALMTPTLS